MMVDPSKCMHMCTVPEMSNAHAHMLPKYLACSVHAQRCQGHGSDIVQTSWISVKARREHRVQVV